MLNKVHLIGHIGKNPIIKDAGDTKLATTSLCTNEYYKNKQGERETKSEWHNLVIWGSLAEIAEKYLKKGKLVYVEGKISTRSYETDNGKKYTTEIIVKSFHILTKRTEEEQEMRRQENPVKKYEGKNSNGGDDDLPF